MCIRNLMNDTPKFKHDCLECEFQARYKDFDLYVCRKSFMENSFIVRFSDFPFDYVSMPGVLLKEEILDTLPKTPPVEAILKARELYLKKEQGNTQ